MMSSTATILNAQSDQAFRTNSRPSADTPSPSIRGHLPLHSSHSHPHVHAPHGHGRSDRRAASSPPAPQEEHRHPMETAEGTDSRSPTDMLEMSYPQEVDHRTTVEGLPHSKKESVDCVINPMYSVPRRVVVRSLEFLDAVDSPDRPGMMYVKTLQEMVDRFDRVFNNQKPEWKMKERERKVEGVINHLHRHTLRRRGPAIKEEGFVEWEQTSRIYELFSVDLNVFERIYLTVDVGESSSVLSKICSFFLIAMIFVSIVTWMVSTLPSMQEVEPDCIDTGVGKCAPEPFEIFKIVEAVSVITFTVEYLIRFLTVHSVRFQLLDEFFLEAVLRGPSEEQRGHTTEGLDKSSPSASSHGPRLRPFTDKLEGKCMRTFKKMTSPENLIDLFAILPFWIEVFQKMNGAEPGGGGFLVVLRILRLTRVFRVFKLGKYNEVFTLFARVVEQSLPALLLMIFFICLGCCLFGTLLWFAEQGTWYPKGEEKLIELGITTRGAYLRHTGSKDSDDLEESPFYSIIHSFWFVIVTITTVGYGDLSPTTPIGKIIGGLTILNGVIVLAMPIGVVGANFSSEYYKVLEEKKRRQRLKKQLDTLAAVEEEQDRFLSSEPSGLLSPTNSKGTSTVATEFRKIDDKRNRLLMDAEALDSKWEKFMPPVLYQDLTDQLREIVNGLLCFDTGSSSAPAAGTKPVISMTKLLDLDQLSISVNAAIFSVTSIEDLADFGLTEAHEQRQSWSEFVKSCWEYAVGMCQVKPKASPPEYFEMKASLARGREPTNQRKTLRRPSSKDDPEPYPRRDSKEATKVRTDEVTISTPDLGSPMSGLQHRGDPEDCRDARLDTLSVPPKPGDDQRSHSETEKDVPEVTGPAVAESSKAQSSDLPGMLTTDHVNRTQVQVDLT